MVNAHVEMSIPLFSVVIPVFNRAELIGATLDSILAQEFTDWEVIVVDDGSTDHTLEVLAEYQARFASRLRVLQQANSGPGAARNSGIETAHGRYIAFLDSDDLWFPWTLSFYAALIEEHQQPAFIAGAPLVFENVADCESTMRMTCGKAKEEQKVQLFSDYFASGDQWRWFSVSSFVIRTETLKGKAFNLRPINGEDIDFTMQMGTEKGFVDVQAPPTFGYRQHTNSIMSNIARTVEGMNSLIRNERSNGYPGGRARKKDRLTLLSLHIRPACFEFLRRGYRREAWRIYINTLGWHLRLGRLRFLLGFLVHSVRSSFRSAEAT